MLTRRTDGGACHPKARAWIIRGSRPRRQLLAISFIQFFMARSCAIRSVFHSGNHDPSAPQGEGGADRRVIKAPRFLNLSGVSHRRGVRLLTCLHDYLKWG
nr:MAG TPA: hypothetical protein [Caudoviricetes sp.]